MKIFFRYLFMRLLIPFLVGLFACTVIWMMVDLYGNMDDFLAHKVNLHLILYFYSLRIPQMLVQVLPAALLFSTLWTLMSLNRRCELVAFQSGGMAPIWLFTPFFLFALIWAVVLAIDLNGPAARAEVTRERVLKQVNGQSAKFNVFDNLGYIDKVNRRVWFFQRLDANQGTAKGVEILERDAQGRDMVKYFAREAKWTGESWRLTGVFEIIFASNGGTQDQKVYEEKDLDITTPPSQLSLIVSQPDQLTVAGLSRYIETSTASESNLAQYRTEWWYRVLQPFSLIVLMLYALLQGTRTDRRSAIVGVVVAIIVFIVYTVLMYVFMSLGQHNRLPPFISVIAMQVIFGAIALHLLALQNGWWWQLWEYGKSWQMQEAADRAAERDDIAG